MNNQNHIANIFYGGASSIARILLANFGASSVPVVEASSTYTDGKVIYIDSNYLVFKGVEMDSLRAALLHEILHLIHTPWPSSVEPFGIAMTAIEEQRVDGYRKHLSNKRFSDETSCLGLFETIRNMIEDWRIMVLGCQTFLGTKQLMGGLYKKVINSGELKFKLDDSGYQGVSALIWVGLLKESFPEMFGDCNVDNAFLNRQRRDNYESFVYAGFHQRCLDETFEPMTCMDVAYDYVVHLMAQDQITEVEQSETQTFIGIPMDTVKQFLEKVLKNELKKLKKGDEVGYQTTCEMTKGDLNYGYKAFDNPKGYDSSKAFQKASMLANKFYDKILAQKEIRRFADDSGRRIRRREFLKAATLDGYIPSKMFYNKTEQDFQEVAVSIMIDCSGSVSGRIGDLTEMAVVLGEVFNKMEIPYEVTGFTTSVPNNTKGRYRKVVNYTPKSFDVEDGSKIPSILTFFGKHGNMNCDGASMEYVGKRLLDRTEKRRILISISDGVPSGYASNQMGFNHIKNSREALEANGVEFYAVGIDYKLNSKYYGENVVEVKGDVFTQLLNLIVQNVENGKSKSNTKKSCVVFA